MRNKKLKKEENKKEAMEQNSDSGYEESAVKLNKKHSRAKTVGSVELKKTAQKQKPGKTAKSPQNVKKEGSAAPIKARQVKREESATPTRATKVKSEKANTEPRRRSARLACP